MSDSNQAQIDLWNGRVGEKFVALQASLDLMFAHASAALQARVGPVAGQRVLDVGCGTGATCALWLADGAQVTGLDVSAPMLAVAAEQTGGRAKWVQADASVWQSETLFDLAVSQFGLMFFADPDRAFANIAANLRTGGRLVFSCWREEAHNQWVTLPMDAVRELLPTTSPLTTTAPGPFALADRARLAGILARAGFTQLVFTALDFPLCLTRDGGVEAAVRLILQIGPSASALAETSKAVRVTAAERLKLAFAAHDKDGSVALGGAIWLVEAIKAG